MTVRMVPSTGFAMAEYAESEARTTACAKSSVVTRGRSGNPSEKPQKNCARIAPEFPRAPPTASSARHRDISRTCRWRTRAMPTAIFWSVEATFVPVSPSATGKTLILFRPSARSETKRAPAMTERERRRPSRYPTAITASSAKTDSRLQGRRSDLGGGLLLARFFVLADQCRETLQVEENHAAAHAGPRIDSLRAPVEETVFPGFLPEVRRVHTSRAQHLTGTERALALEISHRTGRGYPGRTETGNRESGTGNRTAALRFPISNFRLRARRPPPQNQV